jgi:hypothetical protein
MNTSTANAERLGGRMRDGYRAGEKPSALIRSVYAEVPSGLFVIVVLRAAFALSSAQCKTVSTFLGRGGTVEGMDDGVVDAYLRPLIERLRPGWDGSNVRRP